MTRSRTIARVVRPPLARHGDAFEAYRLGSDIFGHEGDPWFNLDHFRMGGPTFPPHPHAGFSAVTYMLPESACGMRNRDGLGDRSVIGPGGVHWTAAGRGVVHEEIPDRSGAIAQGLQIFIRQPIEQETAAPAIHHVEPDDVPVLALDNGGFARVLAGDHGGMRAPFAPPSPLTMLDVRLAHGTSFAFGAPWPGGSLSLYLFDGCVAIDGSDTVAPTAPAAIVFERGIERILLGAPIGDARLLIMAGKPLDVPSYTNGPFMLSSPAAIDAAIARYRAGEMGTLAERWD